MAEPLAESSFERVIPRKTGRLDVIHAAGGKAFVGHAKRDIRNGRGSFSANLIIGSSERGFVDVAKHEHVRAAHSSVSNLKYEILCDLGLDVQAVSLKNWRPQIQVNNNWRETGRHGAGGGHIRKELRERPRNRCEGIIESIGKVRSVFAIQTEGLISDLLQVGLSGGALVIDAVTSPEHNLIKPGQHPRKTNSRIQRVLPRSVNSHVVAAGCDSRG